MPDKAGNDDEETPPCLLQASSFIALGTEPKGDEGVDGVDEPLRPSKATCSANVPLMAPGDVALALKELPVPLDANDSAATTAVSGDEAPPETDLLPRI